MSVNIAKLEQLIAFRDFAILQILKLGHMWLVVKSKLCNLIIVSAADVGKNLR